MNTVQDPDIDALYRKIHDNPKYLDVPNGMTFVQSPLHVAASEGRTRLALEILRLKPSLGKKLNLDGFSPLHLALGNGHTNTVRLLVKHDPELIRVPGREGITLLHYAVEKEEIHLLIYFLLICPLSIFDLTVRDETVVHIAVRNNNLRAFEVLLGWIKKSANTTVLQWRNEEGNTLMHLAALTDQGTVMKSLIEYVDVNKKNLEGKTAMDILKPENVGARKILISAGAKEGSSLDDEATICENYLKSNRTMEEFFIRLGAYMEFGLSGDMRNAILVVVALIATATLQSLITPPISKDRKLLRLRELNSIYNLIAFGLAIGTCAILSRGMNTFQDPHIVALYRKIHENPEYLDVPNEMTFVESPLHTAASEGHTGLALEILRLKPSLGKKLNLDGLSPLHVALGNGHTKIVRRLVKHDPDLIRVPGREGITLLHYAAEKDEIDLLIYFLLLCPLSIIGLTVRDETVVHITVKNKNLRAFKVLFGWARKTNNTTVFRWRNEEGNNLMHLAALTNQPTVMKSLIGYVHVSKKNLGGKTALDILEPGNFEVRKILLSAGAKEGSSLVNDATSCENYLKSNRTMEDIFVKFGAYMEYGLSGSMRSAILVVVSLIATATAQNLITPPTPTNQKLRRLEEIDMKQGLHQMFCHASQSISPKAH